MLIVSMTMMKNYISALKKTYFAVCKTARTPDNGT
jgi:hypothetical protein